MIDPDKTSFTAIATARQFVVDCQNRFAVTVDEALREFRSDALLGRHPPGSSGWAPDAMMRRVTNDDPDEYPPTNETQWPRDRDDFEVLTPRQMLYHLANHKDPVAFHWTTTDGTTDEEALQQLAKSPVPTVGKPGRKANECLAYTRAAVLASYSLRGMPIPAWAAEPPVEEPNPFLVLAGASPEIVDPVLVPAPEWAAVPTAPATKNERQRRNDGAVFDKIKEVIRVAEAKWTAPPKRGEGRKRAYALAREREREHLGLGESAIRGILAGTYPPMKKRGIAPPWSGATDSAFRGTG
jgi:hypothetical protein